jgi:hypothetical protein
MNEISTTALSQNNHNIIMKIMLLLMLSLFSLYFCNAKVWLIVSGFENILADDYE